MIRIYLSASFCDYKDRRILRPLPGDSALHNPTMFFYIISKEPLDCISFELFEDKVPKRARTFVL